MKPLHLLTAITAMAALAALTAPPANAQQRSVGGGPRITYPSHSNHFSWERGHGFHPGFGNVWVVERAVPVIVKVETPPPPTPLTQPSPPKGEEKVERKPYVVGASYASLPASCMKLIEEGASYYYCGGDWYQEVRSGRNPLYRAVARRL